MRLYTRRKVFWLYFIQNVCFTYDGGAACVNQSMCTLLKGEVDSTYRYYVFSCKQLRIAHV